jgi:archaellum component FlaG (FlaF/FlaG flagellin family)
LKSIFIVLCIAGIVMPVLAQNQNTLPQTIKSRGTVVVDNLAWVYPSVNRPADVRMKVTNNTAKTIKSTKFLVIAKDKKGVLLQSDGSTIKKLINTDTIKASESREIYFEKAYNNTHIAELELKELTVEYTNGALEIIK